jgi:hypothetical protein
VIALNDNTPDTSDNADFGSTTVGGTLRRDLRIRNRGNTGVTVSSLSVSGAFLFAFPGPSGISAGQTLDVDPSGTIRLECQTASTGTYSGTVSVGTDDPDENPTTSPSPAR